MLFGQDEIAPGHLQDVKRSTMPYVQGRPIAFLVFHSSHFFVVVFDYTQQKAYIIGRSIHGHSNGLSWAEWRGPQLWIRIPSVYRVPNVCTPEEVTLTMVDWVHVSQDLPYFFFSLRAKETWFTSMLFTRTRSTVALMLSALSNTFSITAFHNSRMVKLMTERCKYLVYNVRFWSGKR
jgi:hypothetical protein